MQNFMLPTDFMDNYILKAKPEYAMVYLYAYRHKTEKAAPDAAEIASALKMKQEAVEDAVKYWIEMGFNIFNPKIEKAPEKPSYSAKELGDMSKKDSDFSFLCGTVEAIIGKVMTLGNYNTIAYIYKEIGMSVSTIILIANYAKKTGNPTVKYIEKIADRLAEQGAISYEEAEKLIGEMDRAYTYQNKIKKIYGIERKLTSSEKLIFNSWQNEVKPTNEELMRAYEECVERTGKFSARYINAILINWKNGKSKPKKQSAVSTPRATKFNNFESSGNIDYKKLEMDALKKKISKSRESVNNGQL